MEKGYWFLDRATYEPLLKDFALTEADYLAALQEVTTLFPRERVLEYYQATAARLGSLSEWR